MLDKKCKRIVKCCYKHFSESLAVNTEDLQKYLPYSDTEIYHCCNHLNELGYFKSFHVSVVHTVTFKLGYKTFNYKEHSRTKTKEFFMKSILVPILVAIATSILTCLLSPTLIETLLSLLSSDVS